MVNWSKIAQDAGMSASNLISTINGNRRCGHSLARRLEDATGVPMSVWMTGTRAEIEAALTGEVRVPLSELQKIRQELTAIRQIVSR